MAPGAKRPEHQTPQRAHDSTYSHLFAAQLFAPCRLLDGGLRQLLETFFHAGPQPLLAERLEGRGDGATGDSFRHLAPDLWPEDTLHAAQVLDQANKPCPTVLGDEILRACLSLRLSDLTYRRQPGKRRLRTHGHRPSGVRQLQRLSSPEEGCEERQRIRPSLSSSEPRLIDHVLQRVDARRVAGDDVLCRPRRPIVAISADVPIDFADTPQHLTARALQRRGEPGSLQIS